MIHLEINKLCINVEIIVWDYYNNQIVSWLTVMFTEFYFHHEKYQDRQQGCHNHMKKKTRVSYIIAD